MLKMSNFFSFILSGLLSIILPVKLYLLVVGIVIILDTFYSIMCLSKNGESFSFSKLLNGIIRKTAIYGSAVISIFYIEMFIFQDIMLHFVPISNIITKVITMAVLSKELISINKSYKTLNGTSIMDNIKDVFKFFKSVKNDVKDTTDNE